MMEALWDDLTHGDPVYASPDWHCEALQETERAQQAGALEFIDWESAKRLLARASVEDSRATETRIRAALKVD